MEWCTVSYNNKHAIKNNLVKPSYKIQKIDQYDLDGNFITAGNSISQASRELKVQKESIRKVLKDIFKKSQGYTWRYHKSNDAEKKLKTNFSKRKRVIQINKSGDTILWIWNSVKEASKSLKISEKSIRTVCNGRAKTGGGYVWMYV